MGQLCKLAARTILLIAQNPLWNSQIGEKFALSCYQPIRLVKASLHTETFKQMLQTPQQRITALVLLSLCAILSSCGGGGMASSPSSSSGNPSATNSSPGAAEPAAAQQAMVVMVVEENHSYEQVIGNTTAMPYLNSLAQQGAVATQYYANMHPSLPDYFALTTGGTQTADDNFPGPLMADNLVRAFTAAGKSWKDYAEDLPSPGYLGLTTGNYIRHHNPFVFFNEVVTNPSEAANVVPFSQFATDLSAGALPAFSFVVPNALDDAHECPAGVTCSDNDILSRADQWLKTNIGPLLSSAQFQKGGLLLITFDESNMADIRNGGGRVPLIAVGPRAKAGAQSSVTYNHVNTLKSVCEVLSLASCPGSAASAAGEDDLIQH